MVEQYAYAAWPTFLSAGEVRGLFVHELAGTRIAYLDRDVIVGLGGPSHNTNQGLLGSELQSHCRLTPIAVAKANRLLGIRWRIGRRDHPVVSRTRQRAPRRRGDLLQGGRAARRLMQVR